MMATSLTMLKTRQRRRRTHLHRRILWQMTATLKAAPNLRCHKAISYDGIQGNRLLDCIPGRSCIHPSPGML